MNNFQRPIVGLGLLVVAAMTLWPPWIETNSSSRSSQTTRIGYHFIFSPPLPSHRSALASNQIDLPRLTLQTLAVISVFSAVAMLYPLVLSRPESNTANHSSTVANGRSPLFPEAILVFSQTIRKFVSNGGIYWLLLLFWGAILHTAFSAEGVFTPSGMRFPWRAQRPDLLLAGMIGYTIPGILVSVLVFTPFFHRSLSKPRPWLPSIRHVTYAVYVGLVVRILALAINLQ